MTVDSGMLTGLDRPFSEVEDGVLQGRIEGEQLELLEATCGKVGEVSSSPDSLLVMMSRWLQFSERDRDLPMEIHGRSCPCGTIGVVLEDVLMIKQNERKI